MNNILKTRLSASFCAILLLQSTLSQAAYTPKPNSKERKAIMDTLRKPVEKGIKQKVIFKVLYGQFNVEKDWAWLEVEPLKPNGSQFNQEARVCALLRKQSNQWKVLLWGWETDASTIANAQAKYPQAPKSIYGASSN